MGHQKKIFALIVLRPLLGRQQNKAQTPFIFVYAVYKSYAWKYIELIIKNGCFEQK